MIGGSKVAGAPITWGVSEVPGWGYRMPPARVLREMREVGLMATELGPPGYLPQDPDELRATLDSAGLRLVAGFIAVVLHEPQQRAAALDEVRKQVGTLAAAGANVLVVAAAFGDNGYERHETLSKEGWKALAESVRAAQDIAAGWSLNLALHPHAGTAVETSEEVSTLLHMTNVAICLDTGHLYLGGADVAQVARDAGARVRHVHLKDVDAELASRVRSRELTYAAAVRAGLYRPLGEGDVDLRAVLDALRAGGYDGWYVFEQDTALDSEPAPLDGPVRSARQSLAFFRELQGLQHQGN
jgi:inosose dehydratase